MGPADDWIEETRAQARNETARLRREAGAALEVLAERDEAASYLGTVAALLERLGDTLATGLEARLSPLDDRDDVALASARISFDRNIRAYTAMVAQYVAGWIDGGGVTLARMSLRPGEDARALLRERLAFVPERAEEAVATWLDEVQAGLEDHVAAVAPTTEGRPPDPRQARLAELLALAGELKVRIRNVPPNPSDRYLDKLEAQLQGILRKRDQQEEANQARLARLSDLMAFATQLKVRVKGAPKVPSDAWLDKMEAKLTEVAMRKGVAIPDGIEPPTEQEKRRTGDPAPERQVSPADETMSLRLRDLVERAKKAGLELGSVPDAPSDAWLDEMEAKVDQTVAERKERRKAERKRREAERRDRIERLKQQSLELDIDLGTFPPFPTDDWLARAELRIASALLRAEQGESGPEEAGARVERLRAVQAAAHDAGVELGQVPPDPDEVWLVWAESRVAEASAEGEAIAVESDGSEPPRAYLVYEEGTVQEKVWPVGDDTLSIGRSRGNVVQIRDDAGVSRRHAEVALRAGEYFIKDLGSTKGTMVDDVPIEAEEQLLGGERIQVGETRFVFRLR